MKRDFSKLKTMSTAAAVNSGVVADEVPKGKVIYLDPINEVYWDPKLNKVRDPEAHNLAYLIELRLTIEKRGQLQPITVYPLPQSLKRADKPDLKYGIAYGNNRLLACRLTSKDDPRISEHPIKVEAIVDPKWTSKKESEKTLTQYHENHNRQDLNFVEMGQSLRHYQEEVLAEEGRHVNQSELVETFGIPGKTVGNLLQAAAFHPLAKSACHKRYLTDLDSLVTFDSICKLSSDFGQAVHDSLADEEAPRSRSLIRAAKAFIEANPDYKVDKASWEWPGMFERPKAAPAPAPAPVQTAQPTPATAGDEPSNRPTVSGGNGGQPVVDIEFTQGSEGRVPVGTTQPAGAATASAGAAAVGDLAAAAEAADLDVGPIILVSYKLHDSAKEYTGQLRLDMVAKSENFAMVTRADEGGDKHEEVPVKFIKLISISHRR